MSIGTPQDLAPPPPAPPAADPAAPHSRLFLFLVIVLIFYLNLWHNGYECFRSDHITQIPLLDLGQDPSLFPRDWFLTQYAHFDVRFFHLFLIRLFAAPLGLPLGLLTLYGVLLLGTLGAWVAISKKVFASPLPGLLTGVAAVYINGMEIGTNHLLENIMIPRTEAYAFAYWGLFLILAGRPFAAGLLLGLSAYCQMAVGGLFAFPMLAWMLFTIPGRQRWKQAALFAAGIALLMIYPLLFKSKGFLAQQTVSDAEAIRLAAYIRHPHHMIPHLWGGQWAQFFMLLLLAANAWRGLRREHPRAWALGGLAVIVIVCLAVSTIFIEIVPVKNVILSQPYRAAVLLYFVLLLIFSTHLLDLLRRPSLLANARAVLLILALQDWKLFAPLVLVELALVTADDSRRPPPAAWSWAGLALALAAGMAYREGLTADLPHVWWRLARVAAALVIALALARRFDLWRRTVLLRRVAGAAAAGGVLLISSFFWLPYAKWIDEAGGERQKDAGIRCYDFQFQPLPIMALERLGAWASRNTPKDALFLIPPEREMYGFHVWAKRSVVFAFKFFPYNPQGLKEWRERFLALQGVGDPDSEQARRAIDEAVRDKGGELVDDIYYTLTQDQALALADRYGADYMITRMRYKHPRFIELTRDYNRTKSRKNARLLYLYRILGRGAGAGTGR